MTTPNLRQLVSTHGSIRAAARSISMPESTMRSKLVREKSVEFDISEVGDPINVEALIAHRMDQFAHKLAVHSASQIRTIRMKTNDPIGIGCVGDPHVDDDGTDLKLLYEHADLFDGRNPGLHAVLLGDVWNNWQGRLARLWSEQGTSGEQARALVTHYLTYIRWLAVVFGNHDAWSGTSDILKEILKVSTSIQTPNGQKLRIVFPNKREVIIHARHKWTGRSEWVQQFGAIKGAMRDGQCDLYVGGDYHVSGYSNGWHPGTEKMWHALQVASYKALDRYADELGLARRDPYVCPVLVIDPKATTSSSFTHVEFDPYNGADRLKWLRARA
jgi:hypothetical protein